jgi:hypothetical protein
VLEGLLYLRATVLGHLRTSSRRLSHETPIGVNSPG